MLMSLQPPRLPAVSPPTSRDPQLLAPALLDAPVCAAIPAPLRTLLREAIAGGADFIKIYEMVTPEVFAAGRMMCRRRPASS